MDKDSEAIKEFMKMTLNQRKKATKESIRKLKYLLESKMQKFELFPSVVERTFDVNKFLDSVDRMYLIHHACIGEITHLLELWDLGEIAEGLSSTIKGYRTIYEGLIEALVDRLEELQELKNSSRIKYVYKTKADSQHFLGSAVEMDTMRLTRKAELEQEEIKLKTKPVTVQSLPQINPDMQELLSLFEDGGHGVDGYKMNFADHTEFQDRIRRNREKMIEKVKDICKKIEKGEHIDYEGINDPRIIIEVNNMIYKMMLKETNQNQDMLRRALFDIETKEGIHLETPHELNRIITINQRILDNFDFKSLADIKTPNMPEIKKMFSENEVQLLQAFDNKQRGLVLKVAQLIKIGLKPKTKTASTLTSLTNTEIDGLQYQATLLSQMPSNDVKKELIKLKGEHAALLKTLIDVKERMRMQDEDIIDKKKEIETHKETIFMLKHELTTEGKVRQIEDIMSAQNLKKETLDKQANMLSEKADYQAQINQLVNNERKLTHDVQIFRGKIEAKDKVLESLKSWLATIGIDEGRNLDEKLIPKRVEEVYKRLANESSATIQKLRSEVEASKHTEPSKPSTIKEKSHAADGHDRGSATDRGTSKQNTERSKPHETLSTVLLSFTKMPALVVKPTFRPAIKADHFQSNPKDSEALKADNQEKPSQDLQASNTTLHNQPSESKSDHPAIKNRHAATKNELFTLNKWTQTDPLALAPSPKQANITQQQKIPSTQKTANQSPPTQPNTSNAANIKSLDNSNANPNTSAGNPSTLASKKPQPIGQPGQPDSTAPQKPQNQSKDEPKTSPNKKNEPLDSEALKSPQKPTTDELKQNNSITLPVEKSERTITQRDTGSKIHSKISSPKNTNKPVSLFGSVSMPVQQQPKHTAKLISLIDRLPSLSLVSDFEKILDTYFSLQGKLSKLIIFSKDFIRLQDLQLAGPTAPGQYLRSEATREMREASKRNLHETGRDSTDPLPRIVSKERLGRVQSPADLGDLPSKRKLSDMLQREGDVFSRKPNIGEFQAKAPDHSAHREKKSLLRSRTQKFYDEASDFNEMRELDQESADYSAAGQFRLGTDKLNTEGAKNASTFSEANLKPSKHRHYFSLNSAASQQNYQDDEVLNNSSVVSSSHLMPNSLFDSKNPALGLGQRPNEEDKIPAALNILANNNHQDDQFMQQLFQSVKHPTVLRTRNPDLTAVGHSIPTANLQEFQVFKKRVVKFVEQHSKCGDVCPHLRRFYQRFGILSYPQRHPNRRSYILPVLEIGKHSIREAVLNEAIRKHKQKQEALAKPVFI